MPALAIAVAARCNFILYPAGATFNAGNYVFGGGAVEAHLNGGAAPNALLVAQGARFARHKKQVK